MGYLICMVFLSQWPKALTDNQHFRQSAMAAYNLDFKAEFKVCFFFFIVGPGWTNVEMHISYLTNVRGSSESPYCIVFTESCLPFREHFVYKASLIGRVERNGGDGIPKKVRIIVVAETTEILHGIILTWSDGSNIYIDAHHIHIKGYAHGKFRSKLIRRCFDLLSVSSTEGPRKALTFGLYR